MEHFTEELVEKTFLWARKRLNTAEDAEELSAQILCEALAAYRSAEKRSRPVASFEPWYWKLAANQLNIFLRLKYSPAVPLDDISDFLVSPDFTEDELIRDEEKRALNYAVSRLSKLHREMIIDYYLREMKTAEIAASLGIPESTVRRRLFDAKENLKRSVETMENTGRSSYAPAELFLSGSGSAPDYWHALDDLITKQILVACRTSPRTIREISDEIAVAPVYFEDRLDYLLKNRFLKETSNGRFLTDFVILPKQLWVDFWAECAKVYADIAPKLRDALLGLEDRIRGFDFVGNDLPTGKLMWLGYDAAVSKLSDTMVGSFRKSKNAPASNGKNYRYMGIVSFPDEHIVYHDGEKSVSWSNIHYNFRTSEYHRITYANLFDCEPFAPDRDQALNQENIALFMRIASDPDTPLSKVDEEMAADLVAKGFLEKRGGLRPTLPVMSYDVMGNVEQLIREAVAGIADEYEERIAELGDRMILPLIRKDLYEEYVNFVMLNAFFPIGYVFRWAMYDAPDKGGLEIPADYSRSAAATAVYFSK